MAEVDPSTGAPRYDLFPLPPMYFLGSINGATGVSGFAQGGLTASGSIADGWLVNQNFTGAPAVLPQGGALPSRKVLSSSTGQIPVSMPGGGNFTGSWVSIPLSPSVGNHMGGATQGGPTLSGGANLSENQWPILLTSPGPLGRPDLGDGTNQYVYDSSASGVLMLPFTITLAGPYSEASQADTQWMVDGGHAVVTWSGEIDGGQAFTWAATGDEIEPLTGDPNIGGKTYPDNDALFVGLPANGVSFGNHTAQLSVDLNNSESAAFQVFFPGLASNHPGADGTPNWWYYYTQLVAPPGNPAGVWTPDDPNDPSSGADSYTDLTPPYQTHIRNDAFDQQLLPVFHISTTPNDPQHPYVLCAGALETRGILSYVYVSNHEAGHQAVAQNGSVYSNNDWDLDGIDDTWELGHHLNPRTPDTTGFYGTTISNGDVGDAELLADLQALDRVLNAQVFSASDWADGGVNWGSQLYGPNDNPPFVHSAFAFWFHVYYYDPQTGQLTDSGTGNWVRSLSDILFADQLENGTWMEIVHTMGQLGPWP